MSALDGLLNYACVLTFFSSTLPHLVWHIHDLTCVSFSSQNVGKKGSNYMSFSSPAECYLHLIDTICRAHLRTAAAAHRFYNKWRQILGHLSNVAAEGFSHVSSNMVPKKNKHKCICVGMIASSIPYLNGECVEVVEHNMVRFWEQRRVTLYKTRKESQWM